MKKLFISIICMFFLNQSFSQISNPCVASQDFTIVVLGSSTAAGAGVSTSDSAWVNRYRTYVQSINANNQVVNLAVGGYNSYRLMPDNFVPPSGRPSCDTAHNISKALSYNPDAIIVNLPSNDVASSYSIAEQLSNLDSIRDVATAAGIKIWITTTQPRNFSSSTQLQMQYDLKDSILVHYGVFGIDFWTSFAMPDHTIDTLFDSGDGVHLNDTAHRVMCNIIINKHILDSIYISNPITDYFVCDIDVNMISLCGETQTEINVFTTNTGVNYGQNTNVELYVENTSLGYSNTLNNTIVGGVNTCFLDTSTFYISTYNKGDYKIRAVVTNALDNNPNNDSVFSSVYSTGHPLPINILDDTICEWGNALLMLDAQDDDNVYWYNNSDTNTIISIGEWYNTPYLSSSETFYARLIRGALVFVDSIKTTENSSINLNGAMFDIVANRDLTIDSLDIFLSNTGSHIVDIYTCNNGSYKSDESNPLAWTYQSSDTVFVSDISSFYSVATNLSIQNNDTLGVYVMLHSSSQSLKYKWRSSEFHASNADIQILAGAGVAHLFGTSFYPRCISTNVYYSYGQRMFGDCYSQLYPVEALVNIKDFFIGNDTIIDIDSSIQLYGPSAYTYYLWSDNTTQQNLYLNAADLGYGIHFIVLTVIHPTGCIFSDTIIIGVADLVSIKDNKEEKILVYPNPFVDGVFVEVEGKISDIKLYDINANELSINIDYIIDNKASINSLQSLPKGTYLLQVITANKNKVLQLITN